MKYLTILALAALALSLGACAKRQDSSYQATTHSASTGTSYSK